MNFEKMNSFFLSFKFNMVCTLVWEIRQPVCARLSAETNLKMREQKTTNNGSTNHVIIQRARTQNLDLKWNRAKKEQI